MSNVPPPRPRKLTESKDEKLVKGEAIIRRIGIPSQPFVLVEIDRLMRRPNSDFREVAELVAKDVSLSAKVIKLASNPFFGKGEQFHSIADALVTLGVRNFYNGVLTVSLKESFSKFGGHAKAFWSHSQMAAFLCQEIADHFASSYREEAYTLGLFHDMASLMLHDYHYNYWKLQKRVLKLDLEVTNDENAIIRSDHGAVGCLFAKTWSIAPSILEVIQFHHNPDYSIHQSEDSRMLKAILQLSELFYNREVTEGQLNLVTNEAEQQLLETICETIDIDQGHDLVILENALADHLEEINQQHA